MAEISAAYTCAALGIAATVRHSDYIGAWIDTMRSDNRVIFRAASQASKAADWILSFLPGHEQPAIEAVPLPDRTAA